MEHLHNNIIYECNNPGKSSTNHSLQEESQPSFLLPANGIPTFPRQTTADHIAHKQLFVSRDTIQLAMRHHPFPGNLYSAIQRLSVAVLTPT